MRKVNLRGLKPNAAVALTASDESGQNVKSPQQLETAEKGAAKVSVPARTVVLLETR